jgi:hypothetical protein
VKAGDGGTARNTSIERANLVVSVPNEDFANARSPSTTLSAAGIHREGGNDGRFPCLYRSAEAAVQLEFISAYIAQLASPIENTTQVPAYLRTRGPAHNNFRKLSRL